MLGAADRGPSTQSAAHLLAAALTLARDQLKRARKSAEEVRCHTLVVWPSVSPRDPCILTGVKGTLLFDWLFLPS